MEKRGNRTVYVVFIDLEKACDRVPRQEVWRRNREKGLPDNYVITVQNMYEGARTRAKTNVHGQRQMKKRPTITYRLYSDD